MSDSNPNPKKVSELVDHSEESPVELGETSKDQQKSESVENEFEVEAPEVAGGSVTDWSAFKATGPNQGVTAIGAEEHLTSLKVMKKPPSELWARISDSPNHQVSVYVYDHRVGQELVTYIVHPDLVYIVPKPRLVSLRLAVTAQGSPFIWAVPLPTPDGRVIEWHVTNREAADTAERTWVRVVADKEMARYRIYKINDTDLIPSFPAIASIEKMLDLAFRDRKIMTNDHPVILDLLGKNL